MTDGDKFKKELREKYFEFLCDRICIYGCFSDGKPTKSYLILLQQLHTQYYKYFPISPDNWQELEKDKNRYEDGINLRKQYLKENEFPSEWYDTILYGDCTILEMMVALCDRSYINYYGGSSKLFWHMIENLGLIDCNDENFDFEQINEVNNAVERINTRTYDERGHFGLFILPEGYHQDCRKMELWAQMLAYTRELNKIERNN